jgi:hypothetical protein
MSKLLEKVELIKLGKMKYDGFTNPISVKYDLQEDLSEPTSYIRFYRMSLLIHSSFSCPSEYFGPARKHAEEGLLRFIYSDIEELLYDLETKIYDGNRNECFNIIKRIREVMGI